MRRSEEGANGGAGTDDGPPTLPKGGLAMRKLLLAPAALAAMAIVVPLGIGSSHREAPGISLDPSADNTDTYAWTAKDAPGALTVAANWIPGEVPANGPNFHWFDDRARYYVHVDNTGDGRPGRQLPVPLQDEDPQQGVVPVRASGRERLRRPEAERDPAVLDRPRDAPVPRRHRTECASDDRARACRWRRPTSARRRSRTTRRSWTGRSAR